MMRKIFGIKSISHLIYGMLMLAPILAIGVKCAYVVINKNANQSYSNEMIEKQYKQNDNQLIQYQDYTFTYKEDTTSTAGPIFYYNAISIKWSDYGNFTDELINGFNFYPANTNNRQRIKLWNNDTEVGYTESIWGNDLKTFTINFDRISINNNSQPNFNLYATIYHTNKLDNVFYYAIDEIIQDNNFGKINFTGWFDNMMLDKNIQINQTYTHLFNWYLNYTLFISCAYILWLVLMWFVNFARKLLDRGMNYDW